MDSLKHYNHPKLSHLHLRVIVCCEKEQNGDIALTHHICTPERKGESEHARARARPRDGAGVRNEEIQWIERARPNDRQRD